MADELSVGDLPNGWACWLELTKAPEGGFSGKGELRQGHATRCVFILTQHPTRDAAVERLRVRAKDFIADWSARHGEARASP